jgi:hypothetical protein
MESAADTEGMGIVFVIILVAAFALAPLYGVDSRDGKRSL